MLFENKKILFVGREIESLPYYFLVKKWMNKNEVAAYFIKASETKFKKCYSNSIYYAFKDISNLKVYDVTHIADEFTKSLKSDAIIDKNFLDIIEKKYTHYYNLNKQIISSQSFIRHYHFRQFWRSCTYTQQLNWLILNYKDSIKVLDDFNPDIIISSDNDELGRSVIREISYVRNIPFITLDFPRYECYKTYTYNLGIRPNSKFIKRYKELMTKDDSDLIDEINYVRDFNRKSNIMGAMYKNDITSKYSPENLMDLIKFYVKFSINTFKQDVLAGNGRIRRSNPILYPLSSKYFFYFLHYHALRQVLMRKNSYFKEPIDGEKYIYLPLHLIPESSTSILAPTYINELNIIEAVSKSLPAGWVLYVKEHQAMVGERTLSFYKAVNRLPNAKMVQMNYYTDPKPWILNSQGVVTISGTTAYEASLLGKHSIIFSDVMFSLLDGVHRVKSLEDLPDVFKQFKEPINTEKSCASYIKAVKEFGETVDLNEIILKGLEFIQQKREPTADLKLAIDNIEKILFKGYINFINE